MSLHRILSLFVLVLAALALAGAVSVVLLTTHLHQTTVGLETGLQSVRLAEEMQVDLLQYIGTHNEFLRTRMESDLRQKLHLARQYVNAPEEEALLAEAAQLIEKHVAKMHQSPDADDNDGDLDLAFKALRGFVDINVEQADAAMRESERWDNLGDRIGVVFSAGLIIGIILILMWLKRVAFQPVFEIRQVVGNLEQEFRSRAVHFQICACGHPRGNFLQGVDTDVFLQLLAQVVSRRAFLQPLFHFLRIKVPTGQEAVGWQSSMKSAGTLAVEVLFILGAPGPKLTQVEVGVRRLHGVKGPCDSSDLPF